MCSHVPDMPLAELRSPELRRSTPGPSFLNGERGIRVGSFVPSVVLSKSEELMAPVVGFETAPPWNWFAACGISIILDL
jgi:hypothetical protein